MIRWLLLLGAGIGVVRAEVERVEINHAYVQGVAEKLAASPYKSRQPEQPEFLKSMTYDNYQRIRFIPEKSLWRTDNLPFQAQFFHLGYVHLTPVAINEYSDAYVQRVPFVRTFFDYQDLKNIPLRLPPSLEYAGVRFVYPLNHPDSWDEIVAFLGASYFRGLGRDQRYGLSARGLAINSGGPGTEEFPSFVEFWIGKPAADAKSLTVHALLDSPSVTGAYTFVITPGVDTKMDVQATLFFRERVENLGLAPVTSMFWFGENSADRFGDFRPEVHDSDGLLVAPDKESRLWRPLVNRRGVHHETFDAPAPQGYGLLQRDRDFRSYEDTEARYEKRPGLWVEPIGPWPAGGVRLVELSTGNEYSDNIVAFWSPKEQPAAHTKLDFSYRLHWSNAPVFGGPPGWVKATRQTVHVDRNHPERSRFVVDFDSASLRTVPASAAMSAEITLPPGVTVTDQQVFRNEVDGSWRLALVVDAPPGTPPVELRARLLLEKKPVTETWVGLWER
ncbi:MAG: glucan biosynthesis protein [Verrucomicrobia bacterium]|nr:glucan biosynthesis protein [Verrucomicrobiota bacterium]